MAKRFENRRIHCVYFKNGKIDVRCKGGYKPLCPDYALHDILSALQGCGYPIRAPHESRKDARINRKYMIELCGHLPFLDDNGHAIDVSADMAADFCKSGRLVMHAHKSYAVR